MAVFADVSCANMIQAFANGGGPGMTTDTAFSGRGVVKGRRSPCATGVAIVAGIRAGDMVQILAGSGDAVVAACATTQYLQVIHLRHWRPEPGAMAILTDIGGTDMVET